MIKIIFNNLFVYSPQTERYFFSKFDPGFNIIYGRNTSGKSTLIQSIIYSMGINDSKENLDEIFKYDAIFRLDCTIIESENKKIVTFVRSDDTIVIRVNSDTPKRFDGINGNSSYEYSRYKEYFNSLIKFKLKLQSKNELVTAPLESAVLPFYISQAVGWVYIRESIGDYRFYKDFKLDYLDYYAGLLSSEDRIKRNELLNEAKQLKSTINQVVKYKSNNAEIAIAEALNKRYESAALEYLEKFNSINHNLALEEKKYSQLCNDLTSLRMRQRVLAEVIRNIKSQKPQIDKCPTCEQTLPGGLKEFYQYTQDVNDAIKEQEYTKSKIKKKTSELNSTEKKMLVLKSEINNEYAILSKFNASKITFNTWLNYHANLKMAENINRELDNYNDKVIKIENDIDSLGDDDIDTLREFKNKEFFKIFLEKADSFGISIPKDNRYRELYSITSFPFQGVELHKIIMAYYFSFIDFILKVKSAHIFPFMMDAIFKEDIDTNNRENILKFIASEGGKYGQVIFTIAEIKDGTSFSLLNTEKLNEKYFSNQANLICIGEAKKKRSFLSSRNFQDKNYIDDTLRLIESY